MVEPWRHYAKWNKCTCHKKTNAVWFHLYEALSIIKIMESTMIVIKDLGRGLIGNCYLMGHRASVLQREKSYRGDVMLIVI